MLLRIQYCQSPRRHRQKWSKCFPWKQWNMSLTWIWLSFTYLFTNLRIGVMLRRLDFNDRKIVLSEQQCPFASHKNRYRLYFRNLCRATRNARCFVLYCFIRLSYSDPPKGDQFGLRCLMLHLSTLLNIVKKTRVLQTRLVYSRQGRHI